MSITDQELDLLRTKAIDAKDFAYCPYSNFRVGACFLSTDGTYYSGANVENACYPVGTCAERCALAGAVASCKRPQIPKFKALAVATDISPPASPCGMCRQFINEFCGSTLPIYMYDKDNQYVMKTLGDLLPMSFGPQDLLPPRDRETETETETGTEVGKRTGDGKER
ncbi:hypothetical protein GJ744_004624 [Endocarpon pusillum]|uniref:Cytidine deaminase n=1 Tax=Endocarpon pusillum TaxID=364733 RepID=A0A8H7E7N6_9EURO|nr:hypothetical protein GJ744_004624 [Endocarpon pusillum]